MLGDWGWGGFVARCAAGTYLLMFGAGNIGYPLGLILGLIACTPGGVILGMLSGSGEEGWWPVKWRRPRR